MSVFFHRAPLVAAVALASAANFSHAQQLEEVIVTAQKRAESLQDVPISVSAVQGSKLQEAGIPNMAALADYVPNLHIASASVNTNIYMRGVGSGNNQGFEQSVGMYVDGIYMGRGRQYRAGFLDIERVEVLRGPQGTLFGKNTVAGAVNIISRSPDPSDELSGDVAVSLESFNGKQIEGGIETPIGDTFAARIAFKQRETDGYVENTLLDEPEGQIDETSYRVTLVWQPTDTLDIKFKYSNTEFERIGAPSSTKYYLPAADRDALFPNRSAFASIGYLLTDFFYPELVAEGEKEFVTFKDNGYGTSQADGIGIGINPDSNDEDYDNYMLDVNWDVGGGTLTSITGYSEYQYIDGVDVDWLPLQFIHRDDDQRFEQVSQEFRFTSPGGEFFDYVAGVYYEKSELEFDRRVTIDTNMDGLVPQLLGANSLFTVLTNGAYTANQIARNHYYKLDSDSYAVFGQGTFNLSDTFRVTVGVRYTEESKDVVSSQFLSDDLTGIDNPSDNFFLGFIEATSFNTYRYNFNEDRTTDKWIPSLNVQWDVGDDSMLYASFSQGFKSGGFTAADDQEPGQLDIATYPCVPGQPIEACYDPTVPNDDFEFEDEEVDAFEIGGKHTLFDGSMNINWAAFYTLYDNLQTSIFKGVGFGVTNAGKSEVQGIEVDMLWQATNNLRIGLNGAWLDATYDEFENGPCTAIQLDVDPFCGTPQGFTSNDLSGEKTLYASDWSATAFFDYLYTFNSGLELFLGGEANYRDEFSSSGDNDPLDYIDAYTKVNLRAGLRGEHWEMMAYGRNIFDEEAFAQSFDTPVLAGTHTQFMEEARVYGVRLRFMF
ncbi:TonB-dependent receptor [Parahaliea aestuarii]|uniref:TonB-dependent receptor n=1 Tax=Parahaliea aestuarii TaxID=1852021 RepID=A0A5C8ZN60_9GAMM|nr:TonB-dependent receptor [Parahaliea aestuarii]TXS89936.1 TonB-dependent receptor [Parahaliea aestuarii]